MDIVNLPFLANVPVSFPVGRLPRLKVGLTFEPLGSTEVEEISEKVEREKMEKGTLRGKIQLDFWFQRTYRGVEEAMVFVPERRKQWDLKRRGAG